MRLILRMNSSLDELLTAEFKEAFHEFDKVCEAGLGHSQLIH